MALPLFKLPILAIKLVFEVMGFIEMFLLAHTSLKTKRILRNVVTIRNHEMKLMLMEEAAFIFQFQKESNQSLNATIFLDARQNQNGTSFLLKIGSSEPVPSSLINDDGEYFLVIYTDTHINTGTQIYNFFIEVLKMPLQEIAMYLNDVAVETYKSWIDWNNELFYNIPVLNLMGECRFADFTWILENSKTRHRLYLQAELTEYPEAFDVPNFGAETVNILHGKWVKIQHLKAIEAEKINIWKVSLIDFEINTFLRDWKNTKAESNLKSLSIFFNREADSEVVLDGIDPTDENQIKPDDVRMQWSFKLANGQKCTMIYALYDRDVREFGFEFQVGN